MPIYHLSVRPTSRSGTLSVIAAAAYHAGVLLKNPRDGAIHDYSRRRGIHAELVGWDGSRQELWSQTELIETRKNARLAVESIIAIPIELSPQGRLALARRQALAVNEIYRTPVDFAVHPPGERGDARNYHVHQVISCRACDDGRTLGARVVPFDGPEQLRAWRTRCADLTNEALAAAGSDMRVDERSYRDQGVDLIPTIHLGVAATALERDGTATAPGNHNRAVEARNRPVRAAMVMAADARARLAEVEAELAAAEAAQAADTASGHRMAVARRRLGIGRPGLRLVSLDLAARHGVYATPPVASPEAAPAPLVPEASALARPGRADTRRDRARRTPPRHTVRSEMLAIAPGLPVADLRRSRRSTSWRSGMFPRSRAEAPPPAVVHTAGVTLPPVRALVADPALEIAAREQERAVSIEVVKQLWGRGPQVDGRLEFRWQAAPDPVLSDPVRQFVEILDLPSAPDPARTFDLVAHATPVLVGTHRAALPAHKRQLFDTELVRVRQHTEDSTEKKRQDAAFEARMTERYAREADERLDALRATDRYFSQAYDNLHSGRVWSRLTPWRDVTDTVVSAPAPPVSSPGARPLAQTQAPARQALAPNRRDITLGRNVAAAASNDMASIDQPASAPASIAPSRPAVAASPAQSPFAAGAVPDQAQICSSPTRPAIGQKAAEALLRKAGMVHVSGAGIAVVQLILPGYPERHTGLDALFWETVYLMGRSGPKFDRQTVAGQTWTEVTIRLADIAEYLARRTPERAAFWVCRIGLGSQAGEAVKAQAEAAARAEAAVAAKAVAGAAQVTAARDEVGRWVGGGAVSGTGPATAVSATAPTPDSASAAVPTLRGRHGRRRGTGFGL